MLGALLNPRMRRIVRMRSKEFSPRARSPPAALRLACWATFGQALCCSRSSSSRRSRSTSHVADADHPVAALLQPGLSCRPVGDDGFGLLRVDQFDGEAVHKGNEIRDLPADRRLPLELAGEAAVPGQRLPQDALGIGRVSPQQPGEPLQRTAASRTPRRPGGPARPAARAAASPARRRARHPWPAPCGPPRSPSPRRAACACPAWSGPCG